MEDLAVFTALNHSGSFGKNLVKFKKNEYIIYRLKVGPYGENCSRPANNIYLLDGAGLSRDTTRPILIVRVKF